MAYTTIDDPSAYFQTALWTGNATSRSITNDGNSDLQPDWVWTKKRSAVQNHCVTDSNRGVGNILFPDATDAESATQLLTSFDSDGFSINNNALINENSATYVGWQWKANGGTTTTNDASSTGVGTIDSVYQANTTAGFSIVTYTGTGSNGTIAHGLGADVAMLIIKKRSSGGTARNWFVWHKALGGDNLLTLNTANGAASNSIYWGGGNHTTSVFEVNTSTSNNENTYNFVAYCFAEKQGYSKFGSYTGNGSTNGSFVYTGFSPAWVMVRRTDSGNNWHMHDSKRVPYNSNNKTLYANTNDIEATEDFDMLSNGFKLRESGGGYNASGGTYIYMAFAESPFVSSEGVPTTAR